MANTKVWNGSQWLQSPPPIASISGGDSYVSSGGYGYYTFLNSGDLTVSSEGFVEIFLLAGGGAGGDNNGADGNAGGGGGAGGIVYSPALYLDSGTFAITVGAGGAHVNNVTGGNGSNSKISFTSMGLNNQLVAFGGGGGGDQSNAGQSGGCSGGNGDDVTSRQRPIPPLNPPYILGYPGGPAGTANGGGGGGTGAAGVYRNGGNGTTLFSDWGIATSTGELSGGLRYYGGGGGGGGFETTGGLGGGGYGRRDGATAQSGAANTGGGGGGTEEGGTSGSGGSGIVIVRVPV